MSRRRRRRAAPKAELNVVPYIDVMLVLLVIFMVAAPLIQQSAIEIDLPDQDAPAVEESASPPILPLIVAIDAQGLYYLNRGQAEEALPAALLQERVRAARAAEPLAPVLVHGDASVAYEKITQAVALLQAAGVAKVGLVTEDRDEP